MGGRAGVGGGVGGKENNSPLPGGVYAYACERRRDGRDTRKRTPRRRTMPTGQETPEPRTGRLNVGLPDA